MAIENAWPVKVTDGTSTVGTTDVSGQKALKVDVVQSADISTLIDPLFVDTSSFIAKSVAYFWKQNGDIDRIETTIGSKKKIEQFSYSGKDLSGLTVTIVNV